MKFARYPLILNIKRSRFNLKKIVPGTTFDIKLSTQAISPFPMPHTAAIIWIAVSTHSALRAAFQPKPSRTAIEIYFPPQ